MTFFSKNSNDAAVVVVLWTGSSGGRLRYGYEDDDSMMDKAKLIDTRVYAGSFPINMMIQM